MTTSPLYPIDRKVASSFRLRKKIAVSICFIPIVAYIASFSRIILLFTDSIATVNALGAALSIVCVLLLPSGRRGKVLLFSLLILSLGVFWEIVFIINTGLIGDFRALGALLGILTIIPFTAIICQIGIRDTIRYFANIVFIYSVLYITVSIPVLTGSYAPADKINTVILNDFERGHRMYACYSLVAFALCYSILTLKVKKNVAVNLLQLGIVVAATIMHKERIAQMLCGVLVIYALLLPRALVLWSGRVYIVIYGVLCAILFHDFNLIDHVLRSFNDETLSLRLDSIVVAGDVFAKYPVFGLGFPTDESFHQQFLGFQYFPEDLGIMGQFASMGVSGPIFIAFMSFLVLRSIRQGLAWRCPEVSALCLAGLYLLFTTGVTMTLYRGEGGVVIGLLFACNFVMSDIPRENQIRPRRLGGLPTVCKARSRAGLMIFAGRLGLKKSPALEHGAGVGEDAVGD